MLAESIEDFRAAFVCITNSPDGYFKSPEELARGFILLFIFFIVEFLYILLVFFFNKKNNF